MNRTFWVIFLGAVVRLYFSVTTGLGDDEAYYWDWTRQWSLSYYDHPPMTAWLIGMSSFIWGDTQWGVRFFAWLFTTLSSVLIFSITRRLFDSRSGFWAVVLFSLAPIYSLGGILMVPDAPMVFFWLLVLYLFLPGKERNWSSWEFWLIIGVLVGLGFLSKYTMILLVGSIFLYLVFSSQRRKILLGIKPWLGFALALLFFLPVLIWNEQQGWPSFAFHFSQRHSGSHLDGGRFFQFLVSQIAFLTPIAFVILISRIGVSLKRLKQDRWSYIFWFSFPTLLIFTVQSLFSEFKPHWPAPGYLPLLSAGGYWCSRFIVQGGRLRQAFMGLFIFFLAVLPVLLYVQIQRPFIHSLYNSLKSEKAPAWNPRWDVTNDLYGWPEAGLKAQALFEDLRQEMELTGGQVFLAAHRYQLAAPLSFYSKEPSWSLSKGKDQYDFFKHKDFTGRAALVVADSRYYKDPKELKVFKNCQALESLKVYRAGFLSREFYFWKCYDFSGL